MRFSIIAALLLTLITTSAHSEDAIIATSLKAIGPKTAAMIADQELAGAVTLVAHKGKIVHLQAHGLADIDAGEKMKTDSIFRIHSMTKGIVSAAVMMLWEEDRFELNDPVAKYLPEFGDREDLSAITVKNLLTHTSGLSYKDFGKYSDGDLKQFITKLTKAPLAHEPNTDWTYGVSIDVLGRLVEVWSKQSLDEFLAERIFKPLGMNDTGFSVPAEKRDRLATLYKRQGGKLQVVPVSQDRDRFTKPAFLSGGGGLVSTATDYYRFLQMIVDGGTAGDQRLLSEESIKLMTTNQLPEGIPQIHFGKQQRYGVGFGLGFCVVFAETDKWDADGKLGEFGWGGAASCHYWVLPSEDLICITLEQTKPYGWSLEKAFKPVIYESLVP